MASFSKVFQDEVRRLARKETRAQMEKLREENLRLRRSLSEVRRRLSKLEREHERQAEAPQTEAKPPKPRKAPPAQQAARARITSRTIRALRQRLRLTQEEFARLLGVSGQSVYQWERKGGVLQLRRAARQAVLEAREMGLREVRKRLDALRRGAHNEDGG